MSNVTEVAKRVRKELKAQIPDCKFSVTIQKFSGGQAMKVALMSAPFEAFSTMANVNEYELQSQYSQLNHYQLSRESNDEFICNGVYLTPEAWNVLKKAVKIGQGENWSNSDIQTDYFDVNYYFSIDIGKWNKPFAKK